MSRSSLLPGEGSVSGQSSMGRLPQEGPPHCQPFKEPGPLGLPGALLTISPRIAPPSEAPLLSFPAFQWEKPHCEAEKILLWGWPVWLLDSLLAWQGRLPTSIPRNICVAGAEPFLGSAGGG